jgi:hypothetical protein
MYKTPPTTPRRQEERRLRIETNGQLAPSRGIAFFAERREQLIEIRVAQGLDDFDHTTPPTTPRRQEERRLRIETNGQLAPSRGSLFVEERREQLIESYVAQGLNNHSQF